MTGKISAENLSRFCVDALTSGGMDQEDARIMTKALVKTDMWGIHTHGVKNLYGYLCKAQAGGVSFTDKSEFLVNSGSVAVIDAKNTMGYIPSTIAMEHTCQVAGTNGIAMTLVKNSCHFGAAGYYADIAAQKGMIGIVASNVDKKMTIPGARGMVMGHNPFALATPSVSAPSIILDISSSNVASLRVLKAKEKGEKIPNTWISDAEGNPTTDPSHYPDEGALLPMGNHKGYGIAMFIEIMTSVMLGCPTSTGDEVYSWCFDMDKPNNVCHLFMAIDPNKFNPDGLFTERVEQFAKELQDAPKAKGSDRIYVPGETMWEQYYESEKQGLELPDDVMGELRKIESAYGLKLELME